MKAEERRVYPDREFSGGRMLDGVRASSTSLSETLSAEEIEKLRLIGDPKILGSVVYSSSSDMSGLA